MKSSTYTLTGIPVEINLKEADDKQNQTVWAKSSSIDIIQISLV